jgi:hypothetical protein
MRTNLPQPSHTQKAVEASAHSNPLKILRLILRTLGIVDAQIIVSGKDTKRFRLYQEGRLHCFCPEAIGVQDCPRRDGLSVKLRPAGPVTPVAGRQG